MTVEDARFQVAFNTRYTRLRADAIANVARVTDKEIAAYYAKHKRRFFQPRTRDVRVVLTRTLARANAALAALRRGRFWKRVAAKYSIDQASKHDGGIIRGIARGSQERAFDDALFRAPKDALRGPVKVQFGYYVFRVMETHPARQLTRRQASRAIREELTAQRQKAADDAFNTSFRAKWRARTTCRAGFLMELCSNGPPPDPDDELRGPSRDRRPAFRPDVLADGRRPGEAERRAVRPPAAERRDVARAGDRVRLAEKALHRAPVLERDRADDERRRARRRRAGRTPRPAAPRPRARCPAPSAGAAADEAGLRGLGVGQRVEPVAGRGADRLDAAARRARRAGG